MYSWGWRPYVPVGEKKREAQKIIAQMRKKGKKVSPIIVNGRILSHTFWGKAWCEHLESFSDYENRLPRGRTYVRNGSVIHLSVDAGKIEALVQGASLYKVQIDVKPLKKTQWTSIFERCSGQIGSVIELLQGRLSSSVMKIITDKKNGLFPLPNEITLNCSCPDWAEMCKHVAAVLYGVGVRLDKEPELLFKLRQVDPLELISKTTLKAPSVASGKAKRIDKQNLSDLFDIDIDEAPQTTIDKKPNQSPVRKKTKKKAKQGAVHKKISKKTSKKIKKKTKQGAVHKKTSKKTSKKISKKTKKKTIAKSNQVKVKKKK